MTDPILTTTRVSDKPVLWQTELRASGAAPDGRYGFDLLGTGKTPEAARANARTNLACLKARLFVAELELSARCVPEATESAEG